MVEVYYSQLSLKVTSPFLVNISSHLTAGLCRLECDKAIARILSVQSFKGGTGKSTITANLAVTLAQLGKRVAVVDLDLEGPGLHVIFAVSDSDVSGTINDVLLRSVPVSQAVLDLSGRLRLKDGSCSSVPQVIS